MGIQIEIIFKAVAWNLPIKEMSLPESQFNRHPKSFLELKMTVQQQDSSNRRFTYLAILVGAIGANYGINYGLGKMLGDSRVYDKEQPHFEIPELFSEEEVQTLREYVLKHNRFVTGKEAFSAGVE